MAVRSVSLAIPRGSFTGLLGPNEKPPVAEVGGKQVGVVEYGGSNVYLYSGPDTAWAVQGETEAAAAEALAALP